MAKYSNTVEYRIRTTLDKSGLTQFQAELNNLQTLLQTRGQLKIIDPADAKRAISTIKQVQTAMQTAFNPKLGMMNNQALIASLNQIKGGLKGIYNDMSLAGTRGLNAFNQLQGQVYKIDTGMKQVSSTTDKIMNTFGNTFRWGMIASIFSSMMNTIHKSVQYVKDLDNSLTQIQMVSAASRDNMNSFAIQANEAAKQLGGTTVQMTEATKVFIQQGYNLDTASELGSYAVHLANVSEQDSAMASDEITAYMNAFKIPLEDMGNAISKWAAVANNAAVSVEELSIASQKSASVAATVGVDLDQFAGHIAAIESVTREAPENIGNGLKTIYSRIADVKLGKTLEDGVDLGSFTQALEKVGVDVLDSSGELRNAGDILEDTMKVWQNLTQTQQAALAKTVAGRFQLARFEALMNRADIYEKAANISREETGTTTYDRMQETYKTSMAGRLNTLTATIEGSFNKLFNTDDFYGLIDSAQTLADIFNKFAESIGDGRTALVGLASFITKHFSENIGRGIANTISNFQQNKMLESNKLTVQQQAMLDLRNRGLSDADQGTQQLAMQMAKSAQYTGFMNNEQIQQQNELIDQNVIALQNKRNAEEQLVNTMALVSAVSQQVDGTVIKTTDDLVRYINELGILGDKITAEDMQALGFEKIRANITKAMNALSAFTAKYHEISSGQAANWSVEKWHEFQTEAERTAQTLEKVVTSENMTTEAGQKLEKVIKILHQAAQGNITSFEDFNNVLSRNGMELQEYNILLQDAARNGEINQEQILKLVSAFGQAKTELTATKGAFAGFAQQMETQALATNITRMVAGVGQLAFAVQSFQHLGSIWQNQDLTLGDKWLQTIISITMAVPMMTSGVKDITIGLGALGKAIAKQIEARTANTASVVGETIAENANAAAKKSEEAATTKSTQSAWQLINARRAEKNTTDQATQSAWQKANIEKQAAAINAKDAAMSEVDSASKTKEAGATRIAAAANRSFAASMLLGLGVMVAVTAAIGGLIWGIKKLVDWYNADAIAAEKARSAAMKLNEQQVALQNSYDELTDKIADYQEAAEGLEKLKQGTEEWNDALDKTNNTVLELLEVYPELAKYITTTSKGQLQISNQGLIEFKEAQKQALEETKAATAQASISAAEAQMEADKTRLQRGTNWISAGGAGGIVTASLSDEQFDKLAKVYEEKGAQGINSKEEIADIFGLQVTSPMVEAISNNIDKIIAFLDKSRANEAANEIRSEEMLRSYLKGQGIYDENNKNADKIVNALYDTYYKQEYDAEKEKYSDWSTQRLADEFALSDSAVGLSFGGVKGDVATFIDKNTNEEIKFTKEMMVETLAGADAMDAAAEHWEEVANMLLSINQTAFGKHNEGFSEAITSGTHDEEGNTQFDYSSMSTGALRRATDEKNRAKNIEELGLTEDFVKQAGFVDKDGNANGAAYVAAYYEGAEAELAKRDNINTIINNGGKGFDDTQYHQYNPDYDNHYSIAKEYTSDDEKYQKQAEDLIAQSDSIYDLQTLWQNNYLKLKEYQEGLINLGGAYSDLEPEVNDVAKAQKDFEKALKDKDIKKITKASEKLTTAQEKLKDAVATKEWAALREQLQDSLDIMKDNEASADDLTKSYNTVADSLSDLTGLQVDSKWIEENKQAVTDWLDGVEGAGAKLDALMHLDLSPQRDHFVQMMDDMGISYQTVRDQIANGDITFDINGHADFDQVMSAMSALGIQSDDTTGQLKFLAAYLNALGGASLELTSADGKSTMSIAAPDMTGDLGQIAHNITNFVSQAREALQGNWTFSGIDLPDSDVEVPTHNTSGGKGGGGGGGKGGGGGGSKGKSYEPKKKDYDKKEKDRYEKVNTAIDELDSSIQNLTMDQDRLIGTRWADNLEQETKLLKEQIPWYKEKLKIQKAEAKELRDQLSKDFGAKFAANGQLQNYAKIFDNLEKARRDAYKKYNAATTEAGQKAAEEAIQRIEKQQSTFEKLYQRYDTLWSKDIPATDKALKEIQDRLEDIAEEARKARREAAQNLDEIRETEKEIEKTFNNLSGEHPTINFDIDMARIEDLIGGEGLQNELAGWIADYENRLSKATDKEMKAYYKDQIALLKQAQDVGGTSVLDLNKQRLDQIAAMQKEWAEKGYYTLDGQKSYNEKALQDMMKEALDDANDLFSNLDSAIQEAKKDIEDMAEMLDNEAEKRQNELDAIGDKIEHIQNLNELIYGDQATAQQINLYNMQAQNEENRLKELEKQRQEYHQMVELRRQIAEAEPENKTAQEEYLDALQKEQDLDQNILDTREKIAEAYKDAKEAANDLAVDNWLNNFNGMINGVNVPLEYMADQWERIQENEGLYLDDLNKAYEIQKLQNKYQQMLNDATDPAVQQQITDQMNEQLAYLREKTNLSKYDVDYANAQLEILQKTIALEDARAAKNTMKLRRDSQGNYQYVYAADQNKTGEAENDLLDATMEAYNMSKEQQADVQDNYIKKIQDMGDALRKAANDQTLTREQIAAITQSIIDDGYEYLNAMGEQLDTSQKNMIQSFIDAAFQMQVENASAVQDIAQDLQTGITDTLDMVDDRFDTSVKFWIGDDGLGKFQDEANETRDTIVSNVWDFEAAVSDANVAMARPLNEMEDEVNDVNTSIEDMTETMGEFFNLLEEKSGAITASADAVATLQRQLTDSENKASEFIKTLNQVQNENKKLQATNTQLQTTINDLKNGGSGNGSGNKGGGTGTGKGVAGTNYDMGTLVEGIAGNIWTYGSWGTDPTRLNRMISKFGKEEGTRIHDAVQKLFNGTPAYGYNYNPDKWEKEGYNYYRKFGFDKFDTGGYTGVWGKGGRLAMLHEKELVLNADDTRNVLAAVDAVRQITEQLKGVAIGNGLASSIGRAVQSTIQGSNVEQRVEITANFPNVNSAQEIENALLGLSDTSYQYAYNKNDIPW